jgi:hypothetical protein
MSLDRSKIYCIGCEELPTILAEILSKKLIEIRPDLLSICMKSDYQIAQGTQCANDIMRYAHDFSAPGAFSNKGFTCVDPYTFAFTWLGYIPESLRTSAKSKVFCKGCPELEPILTDIAKSEDCLAFPSYKGRYPKFEFSECTLGPTLSISYNEGPYFGEKFGRIEVSPEVFAAIWLGTKTATDVKCTDVDVPGPSRRSVIVTVAKLQIKL